MYRRLKHFLIILILSSLAVILMMLAYKWVPVILPPTIIKF